MEITEVKHDSRLNYQSFITFVHFIYLYGSFHKCYLKSYCAGYLPFVSLLYLLLSLIAFVFQQAGGLQTTFLLGSLSSSWLLPIRGICRSLEDKRKREGCSFPFPAAGDSSQSGVAAGETSSCSGHVHSNGGSGSPSHGISPGTCSWVTLSRCVASATVSEQ